VSNQHVAPTPRKSKNCRAASSQATSRCRAGDGAENAERALLANAADAGVAAA
jgi:hypothetical protein